MESTSTPPKAGSPATQAPPTHRTGYVIGGGVALGALAATLIFSEPAREVVGTTFRALLGVVTTPFILESTVALFALFIVLVINKHRLDKEGDGWVYMMVNEGGDDGAADRKVSQALTRRMQGTVLTERPENVDEALTERSLIEGYLELGMASQALQEISSAETLPDEPATMALWVRVLASNLDTLQAQDRFANALRRFPAEHAFFRTTALEQVAWFQRHLPAHLSEALHWQAAAEKLVIKA